MNAPKSPRTTQELAEALDFSIHYAIQAHSKYAKSPDDTIRFWDRTTPYTIHPIWCAMTLLTETSLPEEIRLTGYQALLWHDVLEDTNAALPEGTDGEVTRLVQEMTFDSYEDELEKIEGRRDIVKLLKLYDKVSNLMDAVWMEPEKWNGMAAYALRLRQFVLQTYGELNIVKIAAAICR